MRPSSRSAPAPSEPAASEAPASPLSPAASSNRALYPEEWLVAAGVLLAIFLAFTLLPGNPVTVVLGAFVLLFAPGYGLAAMLFGGSGRSFSRAAHLAMIVGFSVLYNGSIGILLLVAGVGLGAFVLGLLAFFPLAGGIIFQAYRRERRSFSSVLLRFRNGLRLPGFTRGQRRLAWVLLVATLLVFGAFAYLATVPPPSPPALSLTVTGPDGTSHTLPSGGVTNRSLSVLLTLHAAANVPSAELRADSVRIGQNASFPSTVPWSSPLPLGPGVTSSELLAIPPGGTLTEAVSFEFGAAGTYVLSFSLIDLGRNSTVTVALSEVIA